MLRTMILFCTAIFWLVNFAVPAGAQSNEIMLADTDVTAEADADKVSSQIDTMNNNIKACIKTHQAEALECQCKFPDDLDRLKFLYDQALRLHPDWEGRVVSYKKGTAPTTSVSFSGLKSQLESCANMGKPGKVQ